MLPYNEIKKDIKNGFDYFEYDGYWNGLYYIIQYNVNFDTVAVFFEDLENNCSASCSFYLDEFLNDIMSSYKNYVKVMNEVIYYNMQENI